MPLIYTVPQSHCVVVERMGRFSKIQKQGLHFKLPIIESVRRVDEWGATANKGGYQIELTEQQTDTPVRTCHTRDNVEIDANASVYWRIVDAKKALYEVDVLPTSIADIALNALRSNIGTLDLDQVLSERQELNKKIAAQLSDTARKWGVQFTRIEIQELKTADATADAMRQQMEAERARRAMVARAEGEAEAKIRVAEADKAAAVLRAEGRARAIELMAEAESMYLRRLQEHSSSSSASRILVAQKYLDGFDTISKNPASKVYLPNTFSGVFSLPVDSDPSPPDGE